MCLLKLKTKQNQKLHEPLHALKHGYNRNLVMNRYMLGLLFLMDHISNLTPD